MQCNLITILGPTAVGKTRLGAQLADKFNGEIISADSRQVYKRMDIGTGKDLNDYNVDEKIIPYHLIDVLDPADEFNLFLFNELFYKAFNNIIKRNKTPFLVGGTGLYLSSVLRNYELTKVDFDKEKYESYNQMDLPELQNILKRKNPKLHNTTDLLIKDRIIKAILISEKDNNNNIEDKNKINSLIIGVSLERDKVKARITERLKYRLENGMIEEVKKLVDEGISFEKLEFFGLEYKYIAKYLRTELSYKEMFEKLNIAIHQFSKRQMTWFRKIEREGIKIHWINSADVYSAEQIILNNYIK